MLTTLCHETQGKFELNPHALGVSEAELSAHLKICRRQLYNWRIAGIIPYFKLGKAVRFRPTDVAAALERMRVG